VCDVKIKHMLKTGLKNIVLVSVGIITGTGIIMAVNASPVVYEYYLDEDNDGYGTEVMATSTSDVLEGYAKETGDCDDGDASIYPTAPEVCDGVDSNCDGNIDDDIKTTYFFDADGDFFGGISASTTEACTAPVNYVADNTDCDDFDVAINTGAIEVCDGVDNNCDGDIDEGVTITYFIDTDGDLFGDASASTTKACSAPVDYVEDSTDCNDADATINPDAVEIADTYDNDCDGFVDEGFADHTYYMDADMDGFGDPSIATTSIVALANHVLNNGDCDDSDININPDATEVCDGKDNNCIDGIDEDVTTIYFFDADGDLFGGISASSTESCTAPANYVAGNTDCNDGNSSINPDADEIDDGIDNNCDGNIDEGFDNEETYYMDADIDGFGDPLVSTTSSEAVTGYVLNDGDCDDANAAIHPDVDEIDDNVDNNCDGIIDEGFDDADTIEPGDCDDYNNHGQYVSAWTHYLNNLKKEGIIKKWKKGELLKKKAKKKISEGCGWEKEVKKPKKHKKHVKHEKPKHEKHVKHKKHKKH
jgi:large repetitive protein